MDDAPWSPDWTRATLPLAALLLLQARPAHGYLLLQSLDQMGYAGIKGSTLYPSLSRLEERGWIAHNWDHSEAGPGRKVFTVTPEGVLALRKLLAEWRAIATMIASSTESVEGE